MSRNMIASEAKSSYVTYKPDFERDGVVCIRSLLAEDKMKIVDEAIQYMIDHPGPAAYPRPEQGPFLYSDNGNTEIWRSDVFSRLMQNTPIGEVCQALFGEDNVWFVNEQIFWKEGDYLKRTPWHQDGSYFNYDGDDQAAFWIATASIPRSNALEFIRGSQKGPLYNGFASWDDKDVTTPLFKETDRPRLPDIESERAKYDIIGWEVQRGDVIVFHPKTLHGGAAAEVGKPRRSLTLRFCGLRTVRTPRPTAPGSGLYAEHGFWAAVDRLKVGEPISSLSEALRIRPARP